jgi:hypothetical protein
MNLPTKWAKKFLSGKESFPFQLAVLAIYIFIGIPLAKGIYINEILILIFYFLLLSGGIPFLKSKGKTGIILFLTLMPFSFLLMYLILDSVWLKFVTNIFLIVYCVLLGTVNLIRTFSGGSINAHRVQGAIIVYLLVGFVFALCYDSIYLVYGKSAFNGLVVGSRQEFMYFSLSTLTTSAYGDITPLNALARSLANLEALTGQLYPAILIARLVSMEMTEEKISRKTGRE